MTTTAETIQQMANHLGLTMHTQFVPWSKSRNAGEKSPSLNWKVTIRKDGREIITTDYMAGSGHCSALTKPGQTLAETVRRQCETGLPKLEPNLADVLHSLCSDAESLNHATFDGWAEDFGMDTDSRKAEAIYRACLEIGLKMRNGLGDEDFKRLCEACQDY